MLRRTDPFPHRKRNNRSDYKQKQRHDDIIKMEAKPLGMRELSRKKTCDIGIGCFVKISEKTICDDNQQHIKSTQHVDGHDSFTFSDSCTHSFIFLSHKKYKNSEFAIY